MLYDCGIFRIGALYADIIGRGGRVWSTAYTVFVLRAMQLEVVTDDKRSRNAYAQRHAKARGQCVADMIVCCLCQKELRTDKK